MTSSDRLERQGRSLVVGLAAGSDETVAKLTDDGSGDLRGAWAELTDTFGEFEGVHGVDASGDTVEVTFELAAGEFLARFEFDDGVVTDFALTRADGGGVGLLFRLGIARLRGLLGRVSPFAGESDPDTARRLVDRLDDGDFGAVYAELSPVVRSELSAEEFETTVADLWDSKVGTVESVRRVEPVDDEVFVVVEGADGPARVAVSFAPDGDPAGVTLATPAQLAQVIVSRTLRGRRYEDLADSLPPDVSASATDRVAENWEGVLDDVGELESVEEPQLADELAAVVPVSATEGEFSLRVELDELLHVRRIVVSSADGTSEQVRGTTVFEAETGTGTLVRE